ncbi:MAG: DUF2783 domain-containing protein [Pseudomonadota bacterium]
MSDLIKDPNFEAADDFYAALLAAHAGLSDAQSQAYNARLVLVLANHIGVQSVLTAALDVAAEAAPERRTE